MQPSFYFLACPHFSVYISFFSGNLTLPNQSKCPLSKGNPIGRKPGLHLFGAFSSSDVSSRMGICLYMNQWAPGEHLLEAFPVISPSPLRENYWTRWLLFISAFGCMQRTSLYLKRQSCYWSENRGSRQRRTKPRGFKEILKKNTLII